MKYIICCLLAIAILSTVNAQTFSMGNCDPNMPTMTNFNITRMLGLWYESLRSDNIIERNRICYRILFTPASPNALNAYVTYVDVNNGRRDANYSISATDLNRARFIYSPGLISDSATSSFLDSDYTNYAIVYSCMNSYQGKLEFYWVLSRSPVPNPVYMARALSLLRSRNIYLEPIPVVQTCI